MLTTEEKYNALQLILESKLFSKSTTANVLLKFLVESSVNNIELSASAIGRELFGSQYQHEKSEANARVNIYHLRKKLQKYYDTEGANDKIVISIATGQYGVTFTEHVSKTKKKANWIFISIAALTVITITSLLSIKEQPNKVWDKTFNNDYQTTLFLSPIFGYNGPSAGGKNAFHRNATINSEEELQAILINDENPKRYTLSRPNYVTFEDAATIKHFAQLFALNNCDFAVRKATDFSFNDIKEQNIIYLSPMRYPTVFSDVFNELSKNVKLNGNKYNQHKIVFHKTKENKDTTFILRSDTKSFEYALAAKFNGSNNTNQIMFFADHGMGLSAMAEYFTNEDSLGNFSKKYLSQSDEFVALFYVGGKERTNLKLDMVFIDDNE